MFHSFLSPWQFLGHIALLPRFMAKANYPGNMPAFYWIQTGTDCRIYSGGEGQAHEA
jgi:hypothetical protein